MKEVFLTIFTPEDEKLLYKERWEEILKEMLLYAKDQKDY